MRRPFKLKQPKVMKFLNALSILNFERFTDKLVSIVVEAHRRVEFLIKGGRVLERPTYLESSNTDYYIAKYIYTLMKLYKKYKHGYPGVYTPEEWDVIVDKVLFAFEKLSDDDYMYMSKQDDEVSERVKEGFKLYFDNFHSFWT